MKIEMPMFCIRCEWTLEEGETECENCGRRFRSDVRSTYKSPKCIDGTRFLSAAEFWVGHLWSVTQGPISRDRSTLLETAFGVTTKQVMEYGDKEIRSTWKWPYLEVDLPNDYGLRWQYCNMPEDMCSCVYLDHRLWQQPLMIGVTGGGFRLPALRWQELELIAQLAESTGRSRADRLARLLFLPVVFFTDSDDLQAARSQLVSDLASLKIVKQDLIEKLAELLVECMRSEDIQWTCDDKLGWICNKIYSLRNPERSQITCEQFGAIDECFRSLEKAVSG